MKQPLPFAFYESLEEQNRYKSQCEGYSSNELLIQDGCKLLPFQIKSDDLSTSGITVSDISILLYKAADNSLVSDITTNINTGDIRLEKKVSYSSGATTINNSYFTYLGDYEILSSGSCVFDGDCEYYIVVTDANSSYPNSFGTFYSEVFRIANDDEEFVSMTFDNSSDFMGRVLFSDQDPTANEFKFSNTLYLDVDIKEPEYPVTEDGNENGDRQFIASFVKWQKRYSFFTYLPEFLVDTITSLPLYDNVNLIFKNGDVAKIIDISADIDWLDLGNNDKYKGCFAGVNVSFAIDDIVVTPCDDDMTITPDPVEITEGYASASQTEIVLADVINNANPLSTIAVNGLVLDSSEYSISSNIITLNTPMLLNDLYTVVDYGNSFVVEVDEFVATAGQTVLPLTSAVDYYAVLSVNGTIYKSSEYSIVGSTITLNTPLIVGDVVIVTNYLYGVLSERTEFISTAGQTAFVTPTTLTANTLVIVNGLIFDSSLYTIATNTVTFTTPLLLSDGVTIINYNI